MKQTKKKLVTVITPTYNRAHTLQKTYSSLKAQTYKNIEWIVVDDGSTDRTAELVRNWLEDGQFTIHYFYQENRGKHTAVNLGIDRAAGEFVAILDSDDTLVDNALSQLLASWTSLPNNKAYEIAGVCALCRDPSGAIVGSGLPRNEMVSDAIEIREILRVHGEMWGVIRTSIAREYKYPEYDGERFIPEGIVWRRIAERYKMLYINTAVRVYSISADSLTAKSVQIRYLSKNGVCMYYAESYRNSRSTIYKLRHAINLVRFGIGRQVKTVSLVSMPHKFIAVPIGLLYRLFDTVAGSSRGETA